MSDGYIKQFAKVTGDVVETTDLSTECNNLEAAFHNTGGHSHSGVSSEGPVIGLIGDAGIALPTNKVVVDSANDRISVYIDVSSSSVEQIRIEDGAIYPVTDSDIDLGTTSLRFKDTYTDTITTTGNATIGGNLIVGSTTISEAEIGLLDGKTSIATLGANTFIGDQNFQSTSGNRTVRVLAPAGSNSYFETWVDGNRRAVLATIDGDSLTRIAHYTSAGVTEVQVDMYDTGVIDVVTGTFKIGGVEAATRSSNTFTATQAISPPASDAILDINSATGYDARIYLRENSVTSLLFQNDSSANGAYLYKYAADGTTIVSHIDFTEAGVINIPTGTFQYKGVEVATLNTNWATTDITSGTFADARIAESNVTQHEAALSITESQISDLGTYIEVSGVTYENLNANGDVGTGAGQLLTGAHITYALLNTNGDVGTGAGQLAIGNHVHSTSSITSGTFADARVAESNVTQHEAALSITESQISDLGGYIESIHSYKNANESVTSSETFQNDDDLLVALEANSSYHFEMFVKMYSASSTPNLKFTFDLPSGTSIFDYSGVLSDLNDTNTSIISAISTVTKIVTLPAVTTIVMRLSGFIKTGTSAGNLTFQWAQSTSSAASTLVQVGSHITAFKVA